MDPMDGIQTITHDAQGINSMEPLLSSEMEVMHLGIAFLPGEQKMQVLVGQQEQWLLQVQ